MPLSNVIIAPQAQLFENTKDRRVKTKALFKQGVKFEKNDPFWSISCGNKGGPYCCKIEITNVVKTLTATQELKVTKLWSPKG